MRLEVRRLEVEVRGIPHLAKNERDARISCTRHQPTATCAAFIEESRMKFINANKLHRKSGGVGHPSIFCQERVRGCDSFIPTLIFGWDGVCGWVHFLSC